MCHMKMSTAVSKFPIQFMFRHNVVDWQLPFHSTAPVDSDTGGIPYSPGAFLIRKCKEFQKHLLTK